MNWYVIALKKYATFKGRASRKEFWYFALFNCIFTILFALLDEVLGTSYKYGINEGDSIAILSLVYYLLTMSPGFAVSVRRLHDVGKSAWWLFWNIVLPIITFIAVLAVYMFSLVRDVTKQPLWLYVLIVIPYLCYAVLLFYFFVKKSQPGNNQYGPNPYNTPSVN